VQLKVIVEPGEDQRHRYTILCNGREFSSLAFGGEVFHVVARHILSLRQAERLYPIYITDIDLSSAYSPVDPEYDTQTARLLEYKRLIEERLNMALSELMASAP
jgi:adenylate cyclase class 1